MMSQSVRESFSHLQPTTRLLLLIGNTIPFLICVSIFFAARIAADDLWTRILFGMAVLYLMPPLLARIILFFFPPQMGTMQLSRSRFFTWWIVFQLELIFSRLPALEELLRLVPGLYSFWLRCWGAKIGRLTFWSPGVRVLDRSWLLIGDDVVLGAGVRISAHLYLQGGDGRLEFLLHSATVESGAVVGGYSLLGPGSVVAANETTSACLMLPPYGRYENGRRTKPTNDQRTKSALAC